MNKLLWIGPIVVPETYFRGGNEQNRYGTKQYISSAKIIIAKQQYNNWNEVANAVNKRKMIG